MTPLTIQSDRIQSELKHLATFTEPAPEGAAKPGATAVTRIVFTEKDRQARAYLTQLAEQANLQIRTDPIGNTFFRWPGSQPNLPAVATGSHIDAIPNAGMYDGTVGVLGGLEAIRSLQSAAFQPTRSIELILFTSEEPTRFGIGCLGSRLLSGTLTPQAAQQLRDQQLSGQQLSGQDVLSLDEARTAAGFSGDLESVPLTPGHYAAFVELHIEQGPVLERESLDIGIVTAIAAPAAATITITGLGGHAGALLMPDRRDALAAAAELILDVETAALATNSIDTVATVGICSVFPGAVNSVPSRVTLSLDVRDIDAPRRDRVLSQITQSCLQIAKKRKVTIDFQLLNADPPTLCSPPILYAISEACASLDIAYKLLPSRAYHDTLFMARLCPVAMIFIPCRHGVSHRPDEYSTPQSLTKGPPILAQTLAALSMS